MHCGAIFVTVWSHTPVIGTCTGEIGLVQSLPAKSRAKSNDNKQERKMDVARVTEITASSEKSFDDAVKAGIKRATKTLQNVSGAWVKDQEVVIKGGKIKEYRVRMKVTFVLKD
jgi:flavin-binding protein dodecin